jgi:hypothetical protein
MNVTVIILIVIIVFLVYYLYRASSKTVNMSTQLYNLNKGVTTVSSDSLTNPNSQRFSYSAWVFVNTWNNNSEKLIYYVGNDTTRIHGLALGRDRPTLATFVYNEMIPITQNFPIQKWVYVVVSVDSQTVDCYLDGKLVASRQLRNITTIPSAYSVKIGQTQMDAYVTGFKYDSKPMNPQQVWANYMAGNGYAGGKYGMSISITKDDAVISQISS